MADLSNQQINQSYPGLLTLQTATSGITQNPQALQDGLGNNTGLQIAEDRLEGGNLFNIYRPSGIPQYFGNGITASAVNPGASQNQLHAYTFYDNGLYAYSAITMNCTTLEAGSSVDISFYNSQFLDTYGYVPYQQLVVETNIDTTSGGLKQVGFASPFSFSGTGPGVYFAVVRYNTPSTPVVRLAGTGTNVATYLNWLLTSTFGLQFNTNTTGAYLPFRALPAGASTAPGMVFNTPSYPATFTSTELSTLNASINAATSGFLLHTIR